MLYRPRIEFAFGADLAAHPTTWVWSDMADPATRPPGTTGRVFEQTLTMRDGRPAIGSATRPASLSFQLDNSDGKLTPRHPMSQWYPNVKRGTPCRYSVWAGSPYLLTTGAAGSRAGTVDHADLDITADWTIVHELSAPVLLPPAGINYELNGKFNVTGNQRSILPYLDAAGLLRLRWSTDGTGPGELDRASTKPIPQAEAGPIVFAWWLDADNGASGHTVRFYAGRGALADFVANPNGFLLGNPVTNSGTTSVFASSAPYDIGDVTGSGFSPYPGLTRRLQVRAGDPSTGAIRTNPDFTTLQAGATSLVDSTGKTWTVQGNAQVTKWQTRIVGRVDSFAPVWPDGDVPGTARVNVTVSGVKRRLRQGRKPLNSALHRLVVRHAALRQVYGYWPCEDGRDAATAVSPLPGVPSGVMSMAKAADDSLSSSLPLPNAPAGQPFGWNFTVPEHTVTTGRWIVDWFVRLPAGAATLDAGPVMVVRTSSTQCREFRLAVSATEFRTQVINAAGGSTSSTTSLLVPQFFSGWGLLRLSATQNGGNVDWEWRWVFIEEGGTSLPMNGSFAGSIGRVTGLANLFPAAPPDGITVGHMIVATDANLGWLAPADTGFVGERAGRRYERLCREEEIPFTTFGDLDDTAPMGPQRALTLPQLLDECVAADLGVDTEQRHRLGLHYRPRHTLYNQPARLVLNAGLGNPFTPTDDDQQLRNDRTVTRPDGASARAVDQASVDDLERYDDSTTVNVAGDGQLDDQANWLLILGTWDEMRYPSLTVRLAKAPELIDQALALVPGDKVRVENLPPEHPTATVAQLVDGMADTLAGDRWDVVSNGSPAGPWDVGVVGTSAALVTTLQRVATAGTTLGAGIDGDDLSLSLASTGRLWITTATHAGHFPLRVEIGGEEIVLSGITGTSSPQTATVSQRSANGVVKSHLAGAAVQVADPFRVAL